MKKPMILVADDMPLNFLVIENLLQHDKFQLVFATNGKEAVDKFCEGHYQLILLDLRMPVMDGLGAARQIRQREQLQKSKPGQLMRTPIVIMSASLDDRRVALASGCDEYLIKPLDTDMLSRVFAKYLQHADPAPRFIQPVPDALLSAVNYPRPDIR